MILTGCCSYQWRKVKICVHSNRFSMQISDLINQLFMHLIAICIFRNLGLRCILKLVRIKRRLVISVQKPFNFNIELYSEKLILSHLKWIYIWKTWTHFLLCSSKSLIVSWRFTFRQSWICRFTSKLLFFLG